MLKYKNEIGGINMSYIDPDNLTVDTKMEYKIIEGFELVQSENRVF